LQIQINTDRHIDADADLRQTVEETVAHGLRHFSRRLTRVEVHLTDVNADKGGRDIRCVMEARASGMPPVTVDELAHTIPTAVREAAGKLGRALESRLGRRERR